ncbi:MAG TPA: LamG-like jellyroll fold domain-containing protein, partial [Candidatus Acidoferrum sp.]|nr:LamG-like jellyroll fold domain-containing protein [Candidatus Acidoferrum sp.]
ITVEGWVKNAGARSWGRIYDFGNGTGGELTSAGGNAEGRDYWFLSATEGTNPQRHNVSIRNLILPSGSDLGSGWDTANANRDYHFAVTWDEATGQMRAYENGALAGTLNVSAANDKFSNIDDVNVWLGRSNWTGDENFQGEYDEFRIYNRVLTDSQVRGSYSAGPEYSTNGAASIVFDPQSQTIPEGGTVLFNAVAQGSPSIGLQWYKNNSPLVGSNGNSIVFTAVSPLESGSQYFVVASNDVGGNSFYATSQVATLTVNADTNGPTLASVRMNGSNILELVFSEPINPADINPLNFVLTGPSAPAVTNAAMGTNATRVLLTLNGLLTSGEFYTVTASGVHDVSTAANVITAPGNNASIWNNPASGLTHRYTFNVAPTANATGLVIPDSVGTAHGVVLGASASSTGSRVVLGGGSSATAAYIDLPNGLLSTNSTNNGGTGKFTLEGWAKVSAVRSWARLVDFGTGTAGETNAPGGSADGTDYLFYSAFEGDNFNVHQLVVRDLDPLPDGAPTGSDVVVNVNTPTFGSDFQFAITWDEATGQVRVYENGAQVGSLVTGTTMNKIHDVNVWLGRSNWRGDQNLQGEFDEFRIYNKVLSPSQISLNSKGGPDNNFGVPTSLNLVATNSPFYTNASYALPVLVSFSNIGTQNLASAGLVTYSSSDSNILEIASDGVLHTHGPGTATVTASFGGVQDSESITVTADSTAPTIVSARANSEREIEVTFSEVVESGSGTEVLFYTVSSASRPFMEIESMIQSPNGSKVIITLVEP